MRAICYLVGEISAGKSTIELAKSKLIWITTILGGTLGIIIDSLIPERSLFKK